MVRINELPDDILHRIFDFYVCIRTPHEPKEGIEAWQSLVHVSRRWRNLVFQSPRRLNLQLLCTPQTPTRDKLDIWPAFPLIVKGYLLEGLMTLSDMNNVVAALRQANRISQVDITGEWEELTKKVLPAMEMPFPELTDLRLSLLSKANLPPFITDSFLGGAAPRLRILSLDYILFTKWPKLLLSATQLVELCLYHLPYLACYFPEAIVTSLSVLYSLESLKLNFQCSDPFSLRNTPPPKRITLPALIKFHFGGDILYLEVFVGHIDTPHLVELQTTFVDFYQIDTNFDLPRLAQFINCTPTLRERDAHVRLHDNFSYFSLQYSTYKSSPFGYLRIDLQCRGPAWQPELSSIRACNALHLLSTVEDLYIENGFRRLHWENDAIENERWLELFLLFTAVKNLYLPEELASSIADALQELVGDRISEVLPSLRNILLSGPEPSGPSSFQKNIGQFLAARQLSDQPISISVWDENSYMK